MLLLYVTLYYLLHYDLWKTFISTILSQALNILPQTLIYRANLHDAFLLFFLNMLALTPLMLLCHGIVTAMGFIFAQLELFRKGNSQIFDEIEQGVLIIDDQSETTATGGQVNPAGKGNLPN